MRRIILLLFPVSVFFSCKKETVTTPTTVKKTNTELLTAKTWQVKELISQYGNAQSMYVKGGANTTGANYNLVRLKFNTNGTGSFTDPLNNTYSLTWSFGAGDESKMTVTVAYSTPALLNYSFVALDENNFTYTIYYTEAGQNALATAHYIPL